jgi:hypothetical protein
MVLLCVHQIDGSYCTYSAYGETGNDPVLDPTYPDPNGYQGQLQCGVYKPTNVISISYGEQESDLPAYYQKRQCNGAFMLCAFVITLFLADRLQSSSSWDYKVFPSLWQAATQVLAAMLVTEAPMVVFETERSSLLRSPILAHGLPTWEPLRSTLDAPSSSRSPLWLIRRVTRTGQHSPLAEASRTYSAYRELH